MIEISNPDDSYFKHIKISGNQIEATYEDGLDVPPLLDYGLPYKDTGAIRLITNNSCEYVPPSLLYLKNLFFSRWAPLKNSVYRMYNSESQK